jgi:hypothetical protein
MTALAQAIRAGNKLLADNGDSAFTNTGRKPLLAASSISGLADEVLWRRRESRFCQLHP